MRTCCFFSLRLSLTLGWIHDAVPCPLSLRSFLPSERSVVTAACQPDVNMPIVVVCHRRQSIDSRRGASILLSSSHSCVHRPEILQMQALFIIASVFRKFCSDQEFDEGGGSDGGITGKNNLHRRTGRKTLNDTCVWHVPNAERPGGRRRVSGCSRVSHSYRRKYWSGT